MRQALTATELNTLRSRPQAVTYYLAVHQPRVVWMGALSDVPTTYPGSAVVANGTASGHLSNVLAGMTLRVGTAPTTDDLGTIRIKRSLSGSTLAIAEFGSGLIDWRANACLTAVSEYRPWPIHPWFDSSASAWKVDFEPYISQTRNYGPLAILGPPTVVTIEGGRATASYVGDRSYSMTVGASITSQTWSFPNGQTVTSLLGSSQNPVVITYLNASSGGDYHSLTVTDGNGNSHIGQRLTFAFNTSTVQPMKVRFDQISGGLRQGGYTTRVYVEGSALATSAQFPEGAQVVIFEKASYGGVASSIGGNYFGRNHIVLVGWIQDESVRIEPFTGEVSFSIRTIDGELEKTRSYELFLEGGSAASSWDMASGLTIDRTALILAKYRSTIANVTDFHFAESTASTNEISHKSTPRGSLWEQLKYNYDNLFGLVAADMQSSIYAQLDAQITGGSLGLPTIMDLATRDRANAITVEKVYRDENAQFLVYAIQGGAASSTPAAAISPGEPFGYFGKQQEITQNKDIPNQDTLVTWSGNWRARENNKYKRVVVPLAGNYRIDSVPQCRVTLSASPTDVQNLRGINWNNKVFLPTETNLNYDHLGGFVNSELVLEASVDGIGGSAFTYPKVEAIVIDNPPPDPPAPLPDPGGGEGGTVYLASTKKIGRTRNWNASSPNWQDVTGAINVSTDSLQDFILDPYDPQNSAWAVTDTRVYRTRNLDASNPTWTQVAINTTFGTGYTFRRIKANITAQNWLLLAMTKQSGGGGALHIVRSTNGGTTWTAVIKVNDLTVNDRHIFNNENYAQLEWGQHSTNRVFVNFSNGVTGTAGILLSTDAGDTWTEYATINTPSGFPPTDLITPYEGNEGDTIVWFLGGRANNNLYRYDPTRGLVTLTNAASGDDDTFIGPYKIITFVYAGGQRAYFFKEIPGIGADKADLLYTEDEGATWQVRQANMFDADPTFSYFSIGLWPYDSNRIYVVTPSGPQFSIDGGWNFSSKLGDWNSVLGPFLNGIVQVPVWTI